MDVLWTTEAIDDLIGNQIVPKFWNTSSVVHYSLVKRIVDTIEKGRKSSVQNTFSNALLLLRPKIPAQQIPRYFNVKRKIQSKSFDPNEVATFLLETPVKTSIGNLCDKLGITREHLSGKKLCPESVTSFGLNNAIILELRNFWVRQRYTWKVFCKWLFSLNLCSEELPENVIRQKVNSLHNIYTRLSRNHRKSELDSFLEQPFKLPDCTRSVPPLVTETLGQLTRPATSAHVLPEATVTKTLPTEKNRKVKQKLDQVRSDFRKFKKNTKRKFARQISKINQLSRNLTAIKLKYQQKMSAKRKLLHQRRYFYNKYKSNVGEIKRLKADKASLVMQMKDKDQEIDRLLGRLEDSLNNQFEIETIVEGKFSCNVRQTIISLYHLGVSTVKMATVIRTVAQNLFQTDLQRLPSETTIKNMIEEGGVIAKVQVAEAVMSNSNSTLHFDGTSDHQRHFLGYQLHVEDNSQTYTLSMKEVTRSDSHTTLNEFHNTIVEFASLLAKDKAEETKLTTKMMMSVKNLMTDQAQVNKKFKDDFEKLRLEMLSKTEDNWANISPDKQGKLVHLNQFFCFMHVLLGLWDATEKALLEYEKILMVDGVNQLGRASTISTSGDLPVVVEAINATCSLLTPSGHPAAGLPEDFKAWMTSQGKKINFVKNVRNRFNVAFANAAALWIHHEEILEFLAQLPHKNRLASVVELDIQDQKLMSIIRSVGLFYIFISQPFEAKVLDAKHILDLNPFVRKLQQEMEMISLNPWSIMNNTCHGALPEYQSLLPDINSSHGDLELTMEALGLISTYCLVTYTRQVGSHLPGGDHHSAEEEVRQQSMSVTPHNLISESNFAFLKYLRQIRPNATMDNLEATVLWTYNGSAGWLQSLSPQKKAALFKYAQLKAQVFKVKLKERRETLKHQRVKALQEKAHQKELKENRVTLGVQKSLDEVGVAGGQCKCQDDIDCMLTSICNPKDLQLALKAQIRFYKNVMKISGLEKHLLQFSSKGKLYSNQQLTKNLRAIVEKHQGSIDNTCEAATSSFPSAEVREHKLTQARKKILVNYTRGKKSKGANSVLSSQRSVFPDPVGKRFRHKWKLNNRFKWYAGTVIGICCANECATYSDDETPDSITSGLYTLYSVKYDDEEETCNLHLEKDWFRGELEFNEGTELQ